MGWIDSLRFFAILLVITVHYIAFINPAYFRYWTEGVSGIFLNGLSGKLGVAFFSVVLGYFASAKFVNKDGDFGKYAVSRYSRFAKNLLLVNILVFIGIVILSNISAEPLGHDVNNPYWNQGIPDVRVVLSDSFLFSFNLVATFWCIGPFFIGSLVVGLISWHKSHNTSARMILLAIAFALALLTNNLWIGLCILGGILYTVINADFKIFKNKFILALMFVGIVLMIRFPESDITYFLDGVASCFLLIIFFNVKALQKIMSNRLFSYLGKISFNIYLVHTPVFLFFTYFFAAFLNRFLPWNITFIISFIVSVLLDIVIAHYTYVLVEKLPGKLKKRIEALKLKPKMNK